MPDVTPIVLQQIDLDIVPGKIPPIVHVSEYDTGRQIVVNLFKDGYPFGSNSIESYTVKVEGSIGKYGFSENAAWADDAEGVVVINLTEAMTAIHGRVWTKIKLIKSETMQISTCGFWMDVDRAGVNAQDVIQAQGFTEQIEAAAEAWLEDQGFTSPTISTEETTGGNIVTFTDYTHTESIFVRDGEDSGVVTDTTLTVPGAAADAAAVGILINGLDEDTFEPFEVSPWILSSSINGQGQEYINNSGARSSALSRDFYPVLPGTVFKNTGPASDDNDVPIFPSVHEYDENGTWLRRTFLNVENTGYRVTVGDDCAQVRFVFGRNSSTGVTMTQNDIDEYFSVGIRTKCAAAGMITRIDALEEELDSTQVEVLSIKHLLGETEDADLTEDVSNFYISSSLNTWGSNSNNTSAFSTIPANAKSVTVTANSTANAVIAILKSDNREVGQVPQYAEGCSRTVITPGTTVEFEIPSDGAFLYILLVSGSTTYQPSSVVFKWQSLIVETDKTLSVEDAPADAATVGEILYGSSEEGSGEPEEIDVGSWELGKNVDANGNVNNDYVYGALTSSTIPVLPGTVLYHTGTLQDTGGNNVWTRIIEYDYVGTFIQRQVFSSERTAVTVSANCHSVRFAINYESTSGISMTQNTIDSCFGVAMGQNVNHKGVIERVDDLESSLAAIRLGLHTIPENSGVLNLIKRCRQMTDIKWTPAVDLPRFMFPSISPDRGGDYTANQVSNYIGVFKAGVEYTGIPYGRCAQYISNYGISDSYVGITISLESFITAIQNANSLVSKESQGSLSGHRSVPYALVCSALASYAINVAYTETARIPNISGMNSVGKVVDNGVRFDAKGIKLGDFLINTEVHSAVITDIVTDEEGEVTAIEISEATTVGEANPDVEGGQVGGICRRHGLSIEDFYAYWASYTLYRYSGIANIPYTPSKYVNVGDELNYSKFVDLPCMPYTGEGFVYHAGSIPNTKILVNASGFSFMRVFKDGTEISGSPFAVASGAEYVEVGFSAVGNYSAYLCNMSNGTNTKVTQKCHWSVV